MVGVVVDCGGSVERGRGSWGRLAIGEEVVDALSCRDGDEDGTGGELVVVVARGVGAFDAVVSNSVLGAVGE